MDKSKFTSICECCGAEYIPWMKKDGTPGKSKHKLCSVKCRNATYSKSAYKKLEHKPVRIGRTCKGCGKEFVAKQSINIYCSAKCRERESRQRKKLAPASVAMRRARDAKRRAIKRNVTVERIDPIKIFERDGWVCHLCGRKTLKSKRGTLHKRAPELEHIVALADGGTHTWGNLACACSSCNRRKGPTSFGQLGLEIAV
ncbi:HNH endonuclease [Pseudomonas aeruginosa]|nr:HNH endonuclease [Pseudomonas aeruginosa]